MTEAEWQASADPHLMLDSLRAARQVLGRKLRLYLAACCPLLDLPATEAVRRGCEAAARMAEAGRAATTTARVILPAGEVVIDCSASPPVGEMVLTHGFGMTTETLLPTVLGWVLEQLACTTDLTVCAVYSVGNFQRDGLSQARQADLLREVFGRPLPYPALEPGLRDWQRGLPSGLARSIYDEPHGPAGPLDGARLGILGDMLEDAGCADADLLRHLREPGPHVRGCWALDRVLARD